MFEGWDNNEKADCKYQCTIHGMKKTFIIQAKKIQIENGIIPMKSNEMMIHKCLVFVVVGCCSGFFFSFL